MSDEPISIDGLTLPETTPVPAASPAVKKTPPVPLSPAVKRWEGVLLISSSICYGAYVVWALFLLAVLPSAEESMKSLKLIGYASAGIAILVFLGLGAILLIHIAQSHVDPEARKRGLFRLVIFVIPGLILSGVMPYMISREPPFGIDIVSPTSLQDLVAPVPMTFSVEKAMETLAQRGFKPINFKWDINNDRKTDQETVVPTLTATYDKEGIYTVTVSMVGGDGTIRSASKKFIILKSVFGISPSIPIVEKPVIFSLKNLIPDPASISQVQWDFDGDGKVDETTKEAEATYTYFRTASYNVSALIDLQNKTQARYVRTIIIQNPPKLPFPVELTYEPSHLIGSAPFACLFFIKTKEAIAVVDWDFGDNQKGSGVRVAHTYTSNGNYPLSVKVRTQSGVTATLNTVVQVVDALSLPDLTFTGTPQLRGDSIQSEVPLTLNLTPHTNTSFVQFSWEAPEATEVGSTETNLQAIYRREGIYNLTLVGQDLNNHVLRKLIKVTVTPPSAYVSVKLNPETGLAPLTVNFDASETTIPEDDPTGFVWDFGDGTPPVTQGANATHIYTIPRTYTVGLTVQTVNGKTFRTDATVVVRAPVLLACMTRSKENIQAGTSVQFFSDCSSGNPKTYLWDFGDRAQSTEKNPVHLFTAPGNYNVQLTVNDASGFKNTTMTTITILPST
jgi:PKD repeat protein